MKNNPLLRKLASFKITVVCLIFLFILTLWGTVAQVDIGLLAAQEKFFHSWFFTFFNYIPFPGSKLVLVIMFFNLMAASIVHLRYSWKNLGLIVTHLGLITYFIAAFITYAVVKESNITLLEGEKTNVSLSYYEWELAVWEQTGTNSKNVFAYDTTHRSVHDQLEFPAFNLTVEPFVYFTHAEAYTSSTPDQQFANIINDSGIKYFGELEPSIEPEENFPAAIFKVNHPSFAEEKAVLLFGAESIPTVLNIDGKNIAFQLQRKRLPVPFTIELLEFNREYHPGTDVAASYESTVNIQHDTVNRDTRIFMNNPLVFKNFTLFQASFSIDQFGRERSTFAVVENWGKYLPYLSGLLTFLGLMIHMLRMAVETKQKPKVKNA